MGLSPSQIYAERGTGLPLELCLAGVPPGLLTSQSSTLSPGLDCTSLSWNIIQASLQPSVHRWRQCALQWTLEVFRKEHLLGSAQCPGEKLMVSTIYRDCRDAVRTLGLPLISPRLTTTWGPQLPQSIRVEGSLDHSIPVTSLSTAIRKPREVPVQPRSASDRRRPERNCPPANLCSSPFNKILMYFPLIVCQYTYHPIYWPTYHPSAEGNFSPVLLLDQQMWQVYVSHLINDVSGNSYNQDLIEILFCK